MLPIEFPPTPLLKQIVTEELQQRREEGCDVGDLQHHIEATNIRGNLWVLYDKLIRLRVRPDFPYHEPSDLTGIRAARPPHDPLRTPGTIDDAIADRIGGGWFGRCAGLMLGIPFEMAPFVRDFRPLHAYLKACGEFPLEGYVPNVPDEMTKITDEPLRCPAAHRGNINAVVSDDDIRYTIAGLDILEQQGGAFTTADVARWWTHHLPVASVFTAELAAYRNLLLIDAHFDQDKMEERDWERITLSLNPYREWIGAQIRADGWALACPGQPERAAEFAWRDARLSHVKNGIYGEMYVAAMIAAAAVLDRPPEIVQAGLAQIPARCRLADAIEKTLVYCNELGYESGRFEEAIHWAWDQFGTYSWVHTINNAVAVTIALLLGGHDFGRVISIAVAHGWDADCNGATAGCIAGMMLGRRALPAAWIGPLNDTLHSDIAGFHPIAISECAARSLAIARRLHGE